MQGRSQTTLLGGRPKILRVHSLMTCRGGKPQVEVGIQKFESPRNSGVLKIDE